MILCEMADGYWHLFFFENYFSVASLVSENFQTLERGNRK